MKATMKWLLFVLQVCVVVLLGDKEDIVLTPGNKSGEEVALIIIQGAEIHTKAYVPIATAVQSLTGLSVWVGIPVAGINNEANPAQIGSAINRIVKTMRGKGMETENIFIGGHSLGGAMLNIWASDHPTVPGGSLRGTILMGSIILRKYRQSPYPVPTMTLAGELDGVLRVTRVAESFFHYQKYPRFPTNNPPSKFPHIVNRGQSHMEFASGTPPKRVHSLDFKPEISYAQAHGQIGQEIAAFMGSILGNTTASNYLARKVAETAEFFDPILEAYDLGANYYYVLPCNCQPDTCWSNSTSCLSDSHACRVCDREVDGRVPYTYPNCDCRGPCKTTERWSQLLMFGDVAKQLVASGGILNVTDSIHPVMQEHPHHIPCPQATDGGCPGGKHGIDPAGYCKGPNSACHLNFTTITDAVYGSDKLDTGTVPNSANELRTKLTARQEFLKWVDNGKVPDWNQTDGDWDSRCGTINSQILADVLKMIPKTTLDRYNQVGQKYVIGPDKKVDKGNTWISTHMTYTVVKPKQGGKSYVEVKSVTMKTSDAFIVPIVKGYHYCKILSPGRIAEWVYVDSLRAFDSLSSDDSFSQ